MSQAAELATQTPDFSSGVMLCLRPTNPESLAIPGGMDASDLHCTLFFFGDTDELSYVTRDQIQAIMGGIAPEAPVLEGEVTAFAEFGSQSDQSALVLLVDAPGLGEFRADLLKRIRAVVAGEDQPNSNHDFTAHITVAWGPDEDDVAAAQALVGRPLRFEVLDLEWGIDSTKWELEGREAIPSSQVAAGLLLGEELTASTPQEATHMAEEATATEVVGAEDAPARMEVPSTDTSDELRVELAANDGENPFKRGPDDEDDDAEDKEDGDDNFEPKPDDPDVPEDESKTTPAEEGEGPDDKDLKKKKSSASMQVTSATNFGALPAHSTATTDSREFDGDTAKTRTRSGETPAYYGQIYAWHDDANKPGNKTGYKFPHHMVSEAGEPGAAVTWAVKAALMLIDDSVIPEGDMKGVYNHLAGHLKDAGVEVPPLGSDDASNADVMEAVGKVRAMFTTEEATAVAEETKVETPTPEAIVQAAAPTTPAPTAALDITGMDDADLLSEFMRRYLKSAAAKSSSKAEAAAVPAAVAEFAEVGDSQPEVAQAAGYQWAAVLIPEGVPSGDGRMIDPEALTWRELPLPLMLQTVNAEGHSGSVICGSIHEIQRINNNIVGLGNFDPGPDGVRALDLLTAGTMRGVSADIDSVMMELRDENGRAVTQRQLKAAGETGLRAIEVLVAGRIMGATICPFPAFQEASITVLSPADAAQDEAIVASGAEVQGEVWRVQSAVPFVVVGVHDMFDLTDNLVASGADVTELPVIPVNPPADWFALDEMESPVPFTVFPNGRCYGLVAQFGTCHIGNRGKCVEVPRSSNNYGYYRNKHTLSAEGAMIATGPVIMDTVHPSLKYKASDTQAFYAHNGCAIADVALYENEFGIVACGAVRPSATPEEVRRFRGSAISGDWRKINGKLELVGLLSVNVPGFPIEAMVASGADEVIETMEARGLYNSVTDEMESLVAAGAISDECTTCGSSVDGDAMVAIAEQLADVKATLSDLTRITRPLRLAQAAARIAEMTATSETQDVDSTEA